MDWTVLKVLKSIDLEGAITALMGDESCSASDKLLRMFQHSPFQELLAKQKRKKPSLPDGISGMVSLKKLKLLEIIWRS